MSAERKALRGEIRRARRQLPAAARIAAAERLADRISSLPFAPTRGHVAGYWAVDGEIALHAWQVRLPADVVYCLPVLHEDQRLRFAPWRPGAPLSSNRHGIPEPEVDADALLAPEDMDLVVVPLVAFDARCQRLGMGGGWYDRSFAFRHQRPAPPWLVGVGFASQELASVPAEPWDVVLDAVCSERAVHFAQAIPADP